MIKNRRAKGDALEYETQAWMKKRLEGWPMVFKRVGMSGQLKGEKADFIWKFDPKNALVMGKEFKGEAKSGSSVPSKIYSWLKKDDCQFLVVKRDREKKLFILTEEIMEWLLR